MSESNSSPESLRDRYSKVRHIVKPINQAMIQQKNPARQAVQLGAFLAAETAHKETEKALQLASIDDVTGLPNKRTFEEAAKRACETVKRNSRQMQLIVALSDIDNFGVYNSRFTQTEGDKALRVVADATKAAGRLEDFFGRLGGEENGMLFLSRKQSTRYARKALERVRTEVQATIPSQLKEPLTLSIGGSRYIPGETYEECYQRAATAQVAAKLLGKDRSVLAMKAKEPNKIRFHDITNNRNYEGIITNGELVQIIDLDPKIRRIGLVEKQENGKSKLQWQQAA